MIRRIARPPGWGIRTLALIAPICAAVLSGSLGNFTSAQHATPATTPGILTTGPANLDCTTAARTTSYAIDVVEEK